MAKRKVSSSKAEDLDVEIVDVEASSQSGSASALQNPTTWFYIIGAIALIFGAWWAYKEFVAKPNAISAEEIMWQAQVQFEKDSFNLALNGDGTYDGFLSIVDKYGSTPAGNTAKLYTGLSYLNTGDFDNAMSYLNDYDPTDPLFATSKFLGLGDCYSEKEDFASALSSYEKAASAGSNELMNAYAWKKLGLLNLKQGNAEAAKKAFETIKYDFPTSPEATGIDKYLSQVGG